MMDPTEARRRLKHKAGTDEKAYYSVGLEVPARRGSVFSMRYTGVPNAKAGRKLLLKRLRRKRVGMVGSLFLFSWNSEHKVELMAAVREKGGKVYSVDGNTRVGSVRRHYKRAQSGTR